EKSLLDGMQRAVGAAHALDGLDLAAAHLQCQHQAGLDGLAVDQNRAGAADAGLAATLGAGQVQIVAEQIGEQAPSGWGDLEVLAVHSQANHITAHGATSAAVRPRTDVSVRRATTRTMSRR